MKSDDLSINAYAKINLYLDVIDRRPDGYHNIETIFQSIDLHDEIRLTPLKQGILLTSDNPHIPMDSANLAHQAADALQKKSNISKGVNIHICKTIPVGAGLGGGSADAAAVLIGCNQLWDLNYPIQVLEEIGSQLGMDIPFCIQKGTARGIQRGEIIKEHYITPLLHLVVVFPDISVSTSTIYNAIDTSKSIPYSSIQRMIQSILKQDTDMIASNLYNRLEDAAYRLYPKIKTTKELLLQLGCINSLMTGSGSAVFGICRTSKESNQIAKTIQNQTGYWIRTAQSLPGLLK